MYKLNLVFNDGSSLLYPYAEVEEKSVAIAWAKGIVSTDYLVLEDEVWKISNLVKVCVVSDEN